MAALAAHATTNLGKPGKDRCFCLKVPAILGGEYAIANIGVIDLDELISFSGDAASQIKDLPDGAQIRLKLVD